MAVSKNDLTKAERAGYALPGIDWSGDEFADVAPEKRGPGVHHCPFALVHPSIPGADDQAKLREAWLKGLRRRLAEPAVDPSDVIKAIDEEVGK